MREFKENGMGDDKAFWCGILYSSAICFLLKVCSRPLIARPLVRVVYSG